MEQGAGVEDGRRARLAVGMVVTYGWYGRMARNTDAIENKMIGGLHNSFASSP